METDTGLQGEEVKLKMKMEASLGMYPYVKDKRNNGVKLRSSPRNE